MFTSVSWLSAVITGLALIAAGAGLLGQPGGSTFSFTTVRNVTVGLNLRAAGVAQLLTGVMSVGQALGFTVPFVILTRFDSIRIGETRFPNR